jgi:hypothetical protein
MRHAGPDLDIFRGVANHRHCRSASHALRFLAALPRHGLALFSMAALS